LHEMPGGQFTNLKEQARSLGLEERWHEVARAYADVNQMLGDIVKVTPSSKMVGDMALLMVSAGLSRADVEDPDQEIAFPESVRSFFRGELGQPPGGFPAALQEKVLAGEAALTVRPGANMPPADLDALRREAEKKVARRISEEEFNSYLMYPDVFAAYADHRREFGPVDVLPTKTFFYGMQSDEEISVDLEVGKSLVIRAQAVGEVDEEGFVKFFFELNGQPRTVRIADRQIAATVERHPQADENNPNHVPAPMPGVVGTIAVNEGQEVESGDLLLNIEAMKMETAIRAARSGTVHAIAVRPGMSVDAKDLLLEYAADA
ncbi:MAG: biotin/lipoyl-binding protein, partial [Rhodospirillaceae bacterium]|nr:biotin/lipoyl-binding protein [Rhodospirillaceae bacterium]